MPQFKQMVFMSLSVQHFLHHGVGGMMGVEFSALSQRRRCCTRYNTRLSCTRCWVRGNILLGVHLSFTVSGSFFCVSVSRLLLWDLLYLWSHSSPQNCTGIVAGVVWSLVFIQRHSAVYPYGNIPMKGTWSLTSWSMQPSYINLISTYCSVRVPNTFTSHLHPGNLKNLLKNVFLYF